MIIKIPEVGMTGTAHTVSLRCPACRQQGTFEPLVEHDVHNSIYILGQRRCPNTACRAHSFFVKKGNTVVASYPAQRIDFDTTSIPTQVVSAMNEAITCHSTESYTAAAIMVRKTLEELCRERGANGNNLKERLKALQTKVILPKELIDGLDDLRLLGNDAAHIDSQEFNQVGKEEVECIRSLESGLPVHSAA
jgi:hypothetical protein